MNVQLVGEYMICQAREHPGQAVALIDTADGLKVSIGGWGE